MEFSFKIALRLSCQILALSGGIYNAEASGGAQTCAAAFPSAPEMRIEGKAGSYLDMLFVVLPLKKGSGEPTWVKTSVEGREAWFTSVVLEKSAAKKYAHLIDRLKPDQKSFLAQGLETDRAFGVMAVGPHPPHLQGRDLSLSFVEHFFHPDRTFSLFDRKTGDPILTLKGNEHADPKTAQDFRKWSDLDRTSFLESPEPVYKSLQVIELKQRHSVSLQIEASLRDDLQVTYEVETDNGMVLVGSPKVHVTVVQHADGTLLGGKVHVRQEGGMYPDFELNGRPDSFKTRADANRAGVEDNDTNWGLHGTFEFGADGKMIWLTRPSGMEWTGH